MDPTTEQLETVDECDEVTGILPRAQIHAEGRWHRAVHIFVFDSADCIFLQLRASSKDQHPNRWDSSAAGHVDPGESYDACAKRELKEELGLTETPAFLAKIDARPETGQEFVCFYEVLSDASISLNEEEIAEGRFFTFDEVERLLTGSPNEVTPALPYLWRLYLELQAK